MGKYETSKFDKEWALEQLLLVIKENNFNKISQKEYTRNEYTPRYGWYSSHFGSFDNALAELGYYSSNNVIMHKDELIQILKEEYCENGNKLSYNDMKKHKRVPSPHVYYKIFNTNSWNKVLSECGLKPNLIAFTKEQEDFIKENYKTMSDKEIAKHLKRTVSSIKTRRQLLNCLRNNGKYKFTDDEVSQIKLMYDSGFLIKDIASKFNTTEDAIITRYEEFGLERRTNSWTNEEISIIREIYPDGDWDIILQKLPNRNKNAITAKASELSVRMESYFWTDKEVDIAKNMYLNDYNYKDIQRALGGKYTTTAIQTKLSKIGAIKDLRWTDAEIEILVEHYEESPDYTYDNIDRSPEYIQRKARSLGLVNPVFWTVEEDGYIRDNYKTKNDYDIAREIGRTRLGVKSRRQQLGLESYFYNNFGNNYIADDGAVCLSYDELEIHNFLTKTSHVFKKEIYYKDILPNDDSYRRFDWVIYDNDGSVWLVEYFGMYDMKRKANKARLAYKKSTRKKIRDLYKAGVIDNCIFIFPNDLKIKTLDEIFSEYINIDKSKQQNAS